MDKIAHTVSDTGVVTRTFTDESTNEMLIRKDQDLAPSLEFATSLRNADQYSREGIKKGFWHVAHIPEVVIVELRHIGVDIFRADARSIIAGLRKLNMEHFLTTTKRV